MKQSSKNVPLSHFLNPRKEIEIHGKQLPHWQQSDSIYFVTWRLADALPLKALTQIRRENEVLISSSGATKVFVELEKYLDVGSGACVLKKTGCRKPLVDCLHARDGVDYLLHAYVIMPNHVHIVVGINDCKLDQLVGEWKGSSSFKINRFLHREGSLWQKGYWDRIIRNYEHWERCIRYVMKNPQRAGLGDLMYEKWISEKYRDEFLKFDG